MAQTQIGAQLYTVREALQTPEDIARSFERLAKIGYRALETFGSGLIDLQSLVKLFKDNGMVCGSAHARLEEMKDVSACVDYHKALDCQYIVTSGYFPTENQYLSATWIQFAKELTEIADKLAEHGLSVGYHNHSHELLKCVDTGKTALQTLRENFGPAVWFEIDTYWITHGGGDPTAWLKRVANRCPVIHLKDMGITCAREQFIAEVGEGNLEWDSILPAARDAGVQWYMVERDSGKVDPFDSLEISLNNLKAMGLS